MKTQLDKQQSQHLIDLGVPKEKASAKEIIKFGEFVARDNLGNTITRIPETVPIFRLTDILEILPKEILNSLIEMGWHKIPQKWKVCYAWMSETVFFNEELIDSLYDLCVWTIENGYLKFE